MMWLARDKNGWLFMYQYEPIKGEEGWETTKGTYYPLPEEVYPEVQWTDNKAKQLIIKD